MLQLPDIDKSVWDWYKEGLTTFYISKYNSYLTEYEYNKEEIKIYHIAARTWQFSQNDLEMFQKNPQSPEWIVCLQIVVQI